MMGREKEWTSGGYLGEKGSGNGIERNGEMDVIKKRNSLEENKRWREKKRVRQMGERKKKRREKKRKKLKKKKKRERRREGRVEKMEKSKAAGKGKE